jgi:hypothetical protein
MNRVERGWIMTGILNNTSMMEHGFWLQILGDHARFIHDSLAPNELQEIETAKYFIQTFDRLLSMVGRMDAIGLSAQAFEEANKIREFKLALLEKLLLGKITLHLAPTFINHMVNEVDECIRILMYLKEGESPPVFHELHHHSIWLVDAAGHAGAIDSNLDQVEKQLKKQSQQYMKKFEAFYLKALELCGYLRTRLNEFPALTKFNQDVSLEMRLFMNFLHELEELELTNQALGTMAPLMADHMFREECYYLVKLAQSTQMNPPDCNPAKPRIEIGRIEKH